MLMDMVEERRIKVQWFDLNNQVGKCYTLGGKGGQNLVRDTVSWGPHF